MGQELTTHKKAGSLAPANERELKQIAAVMLGTSKVPSGNVIADPKAFVGGIVLQLQRRRYPFSVVEEAYYELHAREDFIPSAASMVKACEEILERKRADAQQKMIERSLREDDTSRRAKERERLEPLARLVSKKYSIPDELVFSAHGALSARSKKEAREWEAALSAGEKWAIRATYFLAGTCAVGGANALVQYLGLKPAPDPRAGISNLARQALDKKEGRAARGM